MSEIHVDWRQQSPDAIPLFTSRKAGWDGANKSTTPVSVLPGPHVGQFRRQTAADASSSVTWNGSNGFSAQLPTALHTAQLPQHISQLQ